MMILEETKQINKIFSNKNSQTNLIKLQDLKTWRFIFDYAKDYFVVCLKIE